MAVVTGGSAQWIERGEGTDLADALRTKHHLTSLDLKELKRIREIRPHQRERDVLNNAIIANGIDAVAQSRDRLTRVVHSFSHEIVGGAVTDQKKSGRCWLFAALNVIREAMARRLACPALELSQSFLMFYDKLEKANTFLEEIIASAGEPTEDRFVSYLMTQPLPDGGWWRNAAELVIKYGVVPKGVMPESFHSSDSAVMNRLLALKLREDAARLRDMAREEKATASQIQGKKSEMLEDVYAVLCQFLGEPPTAFDLEYQDDQKKYQSDRSLTPLEFYQKYCDVEIEDFVAVWNVPTSQRPFNRRYRIRYEAEEGINLPIDALKRMAVACIVDGTPVWFACDVSQMVDRKTGTLDPHQFDYAGALGTQFSFGKAERMVYGDSRWSHAMVLTGVHLVDGQPRRFKVENSWGKESGKEGYYVMSEEWFEEYVYEIVVPKKYLNPQEMAVLGTEPVIIPPWDLML